MNHVAAPLPRTPCADDDLAPEIISMIKRLARQAAREQFEKLRASDPPPAA